MPMWSRRVPESSTKTCSSRAPGSARTRTPRRGTSAPTTLEPAAFAGPFTIPRPGEFGYNTWPANAWRTAGGANCWAGMTVDAQRGVVYVPLGSASPDFYGGGRLGADLFANSLLALDAATGQRRWHFQTVHHDLWDRDLPAAPNLVNVTRDGRRVPAIAQITKSGFVYVFDRDSGRPLFPVEERPMPPSDLKGEQAWPTQPIPLQPAPFARQTIAEADLNEAALARFRTLRP